MALTGPRWLAIAVGGALLAVAYFLGDDGRAGIPEDPRSVILQRESNANAAAARAADRLRVVTLADSARGALRALPATDSIRVVFGRGVDPRLHDALRDAVAAARRALGMPVLPIDVAFVSDTGNMVRGVNRGLKPWLTTDFMLPAAAGERCLVLARLQPRGAGSMRQVRGVAELPSAISERRLLGPCAYIGAFGQPGPRVAEWLRHGAWGFALRNDWNQPSPTWSPPSWYNASFGDARSLLRYFLSVDALRCLAGARQECEAAALSVRPRDRRSRYPDIWGDRFVSAGSINNEVWYRLSVGPHSSSMLSDLVHDIGPDRFRRFWSSADPVPEALRAAAGRELGDFTHSWARRQYGLEVRSGPVVPASSVPAGLALLGLGAFAAIVVARRREVV